MKNAPASLAQCAFTLFSSSIRAALLLFALAGGTLLAPAAQAQAVDDENVPYGGYVDTGYEDKGPGVESLGGGECRKPITFENAGLSRGTLVSTQIPGVTISANAGTVGSGPNAGQPRKPMIFDSSAPSGGDADLGSPNQAYGGPGIGSGGATNQFVRHQILIISEDNDTSDPDDNASGGYLIFEYDADVRIKSLDLLDIDTNEFAIIRVYNAAGNLIGSPVNAVPLGNNSFQNVPVNATGVRRMTVQFRNSGSIAAVNFCEQADLELTKMSVPDATAPLPGFGDLITYTITVFNNPNDDLGAPWSDAVTTTGVSVTDAIPAQLTFVSATGADVNNFAPSVGPSGTVTFTINSLAVGASRVLTIVASVATQGTTVNTAEVDSSDQPDPDSTPGNCGATGPFAEDDCDQTGLTVLPVELTAFEALLDGRSVLLHWETVSETNNAGFEVQHRYQDTAYKATSAFEALGWVEGHGTTLEAQSYGYRVDGLTPGRHVFRLKQLDYDGTFAYSPEVEVAVEMPEAFVVSAVYPNPFNPQASFSFGVRQAQQVSVEVFNMLGQRVLSLYRGTPETGSTQSLQIDGSNLRSGLYVVRVLGETFVHTQTITLVK